VEETGVPGENHRPIASHWQTLPYVVLSTPAMHGIRTHNVKGDLGTDCTGSCKSNYHTFTTTMVPDPLHSVAYFQEH
jgi:hypothetical protein